MKRLSLMATLFALLIGFSAIADEVKLDGIKCVVAAARPVAADKSADYKGAKVFFCCGNCLAKFEGDSKPFTAQANRQLMQTGQAKQKACPLSGAPVKVTADDKVGFCCNNCLGKYNAAGADEKLNLVFSDAAFAKGFEIPKKSN